ncbi:CIA30-domain-containing protein [Aureobasidium pullulans]|uniref:CIA30-domain-containing protein n=1 Tax=Aureobasidium pullulans TaxID=5580 RepID=A0A4S8W8U5_AURPU|nr:CIA30-domain-containing protein [Aureobasidium pullulans]THZ28736.1 CIA30-domain-containing protein [Aureobasidium pullulans]
MPLALREAEKSTPYRSWKAEDWTASDDRSFLECHNSTGRFHGNLDIQTLGGAGFASQRTTGEDRSWDLSAYAGIVLDIAEADDKRYTFILKDELLPRNPDNGREQATISWEYDFKPCFGESSLEKGGLVFVPWSGLKPTYRGKEKEHADPINLKTIKRMSIMMRSFFGDQEGPFSLTLRSISAATSSPVEPGRLEQGAARSAASNTNRWTWYRQSFTVSCIIAVAHLRARFACDCTILRTSQQFASSLISSPSKELKGRTE